MKNIYIVLFLFGYIFCGCTNPSNNASGGGLSVISSPNPEPTWDNTFCSYINNPKTPAEVNQYYEGLWNTGSSLALNILPQLYVDSTNDYSTAPTTTALLTSVCNNVFSGLGKFQSLMEECVTNSKDSTDCDSCLRSYLDESSGHCANGCGPADSNCLFECGLAYACMYSQCKYFFDGKVEDDRCATAFTILGPNEAAKKGQIQSCLVADGPLAADPNMSTGLNCILGELQGLAGGCWGVGSNCYAEVGLIGGCTYGMLAPQPESGNCSPPGSGQ